MGVKQSTALLLGGAAAYAVYRRLAKVSVVAGNNKRYAPSEMTLEPTSPLYGKRIGFLGSSITYGAAARGKSFVDYLVARDGVIATKSAVSGTTLAGNDPSTYVSRLKSDFPVDAQYDAFVVQLSTNDGRQGLAVGDITPDTQQTNFDTMTTTGPIEFICRVVERRYHCPVAFYTCLRKDNGDYAKLIDRLYALQQKWHFTVIDLWHDDAFKAVTARNPLAMFDDAHPTQLGYRNIWLPVFEDRLISLIG